MAAPVPTHRFWAAKNWFAADRTAAGGVYRMIPDPLRIETRENGLWVGYAPQMTVAGAYFFPSAEDGFELGVENLHASAVRLSAYSDWTADLDFGEMTVRVGRGMPFVYAKTGGRDPMLTFRAPPVIFRRDGNVLGVRVGATSFGLFCPSRGSWTGSGTALVCHLPPGRDYLSAAVLPDPAALALYARFAFSFPETTGVAWEYRRRSSQVITTYTVTTRAMEGTERGFLQALYAHQYGSLTGDPGETGYRYVSARGPLRVIQSPTFTTRDTYHGILPYLPVGGDPEANRALLPLLSEAAARIAEPAPPDTYGLGKELARVAQMLPLASATGDARDQELFLARLEREFDRWLGGSRTRTPPGFFYNCDWGTLVGVPGSYGSAEVLNDHHFHYGYWIEAAALVALYDPAWLRAEPVKAGVEELARDIGDPSRNDPRYPFLRHFDVYAGHSWASGQAPFADGENEESSSEAINAWAAMILFATETGNQPLADAAIWMYTLECNAAIDYWFDDGPVRTFPRDFGRVQVANLFDGKSDAGTWFGSNPALEHGIQFLPFTGASLYLGHDRAYVERNLKEVMDASGGRLDVHSRSWPDLMEMYLALVDPRRALDEWRQTDSLFDGETRAHEFAWITSLIRLGHVDWSVTADTPLYAVFENDRGRTHVAFNPGPTTLPVTFSDGVRIAIAPASYAIDQRTEPIR